MRGSILVLCFLFVSIGVRAQIEPATDFLLQTEPRIDSVAVNEGADELSIYGAFGIMQGAVWVDSVALSIRRWSDTVVIASIPESGRGSAGPVVVGAQGYQSNARMLSRWSGVCRTARVAYSPSGNNGSTYELRYAVRLDLLSAIRDLSTHVTPLPMEMVSSVAYLQSGVNFNGAHPGRWNYNMNSSVLLQDTLGYAHGFQCIASFHPDARSLNFAVTNCIGFEGEESWIDAGNHVGSSTYTANLAAFSYQVQLDSLFEVIPYHWMGADPDQYHSLELTISGTLEFPPAARIRLLRAPPRLWSPRNDSAIHGQSVDLQWRVWGEIDSFEMQLSEDSAFTSTGIDSLLLRQDSVGLSSLHYGKYYWRVRSRVSEGVSPWSAVWRFDLSNNAKVFTTFERHPTIQETIDGLICALNPTERATLYVYNLLGKQVRTITLDGVPVNRTILWSDLHLSSGAYEIVLRTPSSTNFSRICIR